MRELHYSLRCALKHNCAKYSVNAVIIVVYQPNYFVCRVKLVKPQSLVTQFIRRAFYFVVSGALRFV